jgi:antitoxin MazE
MTTTIQKWGNSLALRLPKALADMARLREGTKVELVPTTEGVLVKAKRKPKPRYVLSELLAGITPDNAHPATNWGPPVGTEILASPIIFSH